MKQVSLKLRKSVELIGKIGPQLLYSVTNGGTIGKTTFLETKREDYFIYVICFEVAETLHPIPTNTYISNMGSPVTLSCWVMYNKESELTCRAGANLNSRTGIFFNNPQQFISTENTRPTYLILVTQEKMFTDQEPNVDTLKMEDLLATANEKLELNYDEEDIAKIIDKLY